MLAKMMSFDPWPARDADVLIVGAGPAGLTLACSLGDIGLSVLLVEQQPQGALAEPAEDGREIALTHRARRVMEELGLWRHLPADEIAPLREARVVDGGAPTVLRFESSGVDGSALGWLVPNHLIRRAAWAAASERQGVRCVCEARVTALHPAADHTGVTLSDGRQLRARLVVAADSRFSQMRRLAGIGASMHDFGRSVVVGRVVHEQDNGGVALECFRYGNTLALLPLNKGRSSAVVTVASDQVPHWMALPDDEFAARVEAQSDRRLGVTATAGPRHLYPLVSVYAHRFVAPRFALIGDAAVGMHPVTAHGWNFGLYGVEVLARELRAVLAAGGDIGALPALQAYEREHRRTTLPVYLGTNAIVSLFCDERTLPKLARRAVLTLTERVPPFSGLIKAAITRQLVGQARR